jgi:ATP-dependent DNA ligase
LEVISFSTEELVALDFQGRPSFQMLQVTTSQSIPIYFYAFDLLNKNGELLVNLPLSRRRELLEGLLRPQGSAAPLSAAAGAIRPNY